MAKNNDFWPEALNDIEIPEVVTEYSKIGLTRMQIEVLQIRVLQEISGTLKEIAKLMKKKEK